MHEAYVITSIEQFSYAAIFLFALGAGYVVPVPEEIILLITGYLASERIIHLAPAISIVILAFIIGDNILYRLVRNNEKRVGKFIAEVLSIKFIARHKQFLEKHINTTIFMTRFVPFLRFVGPVFAGYTKAKQEVFALFDTLAIALYATIWVWIGFAFHNSFATIVNGIGRVRHVAVIFVWIVVGMIISRIIDAVFSQKEKREE
ncbi:MAG: DedA family protein [Patescibacteria group bacterium]|nr:DedA family protein [Patescibacteria group bacterium]MDE1945857.1 DedA family protein [Patescibacteria group bacterium]